MPGSRPAGEIYLPLAVAFASDPKVRALAQFGTDAGLARDLFVQMCCHCKANLTDGFVAEYELGILIFPLDIEHGKQLAKQLASVGLIKEQASGWQVLAYLKRNGSREDVEQLSKVRAEAGRVGGRKSKKTAGRPRNQATSKQVASNVPSNYPPRDRDRDTTELPYGSSAAANPNGLSVTQRSKRITDAYAEAEPMCKWPAVNGVVIKAIQSEKYTDEEIRAALLRMAAEGRGVSVESLRVELAGLPPRGRQGSTADQRVAQAQALKGELRGPVQGSVTG